MDTNTYAKIRNPTPNDGSLAGSPLLHCSLFTAEITGILTIRNIRLMNWKNNVKGNGNNKQQTTLRMGDDPPSSLLSVYMFICAQSRTEPHRILTTKHQRHWNSTEPIRDQRTHTHPHRGWRCTTNKEWMNRWAREIARNTLHSVAERKRAEMQLCHQNIISSIGHTKATLQQPLTTNRKFNFLI